MPQDGGAEVGVHALLGYVLPQLEHCLVGYVGSGACPLDTQVDDDLGSRRGSTGSVSLDEVVAVDEQKHSGTD